MERPRAVAMERPRAVAMERTWAVAMERPRAVAMERPRAVAMERPRTPGRCHGEASGRCHGEAPDSWPFPWRGPGPLPWRGPGLLAVAMERPRAVAMERPRTPGRCHGVSPGPGMAEEPGPGSGSGPGPDPEAEDRSRYTVFTGSAAEDVAYAKVFWSSLSLQPPLESRLVSGDIKQRLKVAQAPGHGRCTVQCCHCQPTQEDIKSKQLLIEAHMQLKADEKARLLEKKELLALPYKPKRMTQSPPKPACPETSNEAEETYQILRQFD
ncbi:cilia- and flagella-associated protein HOATZ isoform X4 [Chiloscyllium plagiosum]|uniref:cilia- and flagella-associated protein HOATZ isoform X4 n=1 Tax=Chiloscyllium plagiosum TaxID=36176 RepID=UPI001CB7E975|nr:cilia- and flagella-associated protein HOATZ isoform X4 [Chiloscyllium plagiosum]